MVYGAMSMWAPPPWYSPRTPLERTIRRASPNAPARRAPSSTCMSDLSRSKGNSVSEAAEEEGKEEDEGGERDEHGAEEGSEEWERGGAAHGIGRRRASRRARRPSRGGEPQIVQRRLYLPRFGLCCRKSDPRRTLPGRRRPHRLSE
eukprot:scaffold191203_cov40-Tisochrysis_lutea.AAC.4